METKQEDNQPHNQAPPNSAGTNIPEWVMHLLTGIGTMSAEYMLFIKPLQEKIEWQSRLIKEQDERLSDLEEMAQGRRKIKRRSNLQDNDGEEDDYELDRELFQVKRKPRGLSKYSKHTDLKL